jgi:salicylate hydroxylase
MERKILLAGGGIGGLATALACGHRGMATQLFEQKRVLSEVGAGVQLGPNAVRLLESWGLRAALDAVACFPQRLEVRSAHSGDLLGRLPLGARALQRYGARYATIARVDLHTLLHRAVLAQGLSEIHLGRAAQRVSQDASAVELLTDDDRKRRANVLIAADGVWSHVRNFLRQDVQPVFSGHLAYRAMAKQADLPQALRSDCVTVWLGPAMHAVQYPVHGGEVLNLVVIVEGASPDPAQEWEQAAVRSDLLARLPGACGDLHDLVAAMAQWRLWPLSRLPHLRGPQDMAFGRIALLGDAAHPMLPYLAQGAGMAIEDAAVLAACLHQGPADDAKALLRYAALRWKRNARVQARAARNGEIFHATGLTAWGRDTAMRLLGARLLDMPWLYRGV